jgi:hypothetical protein
MGQKEVRGCDRSYEWMRDVLAESMAEIDEVVGWLGVTSSLDSAVETLVWAGWMAQQGEKCRKAVAFAHEA